MESAEALTSWAGLLADRTRATFCLALLDGRAWTVGELARHAGVAVSTASEHADRLQAGGLLTGHRQGRHRYLRLAGPEVAALIEAVAATGTKAGGPTEGPTGKPVSTLRAAHRQRNLAYARTCYDHLAGTVGVALADAMVAGKLVSRDAGLVLTDRGAAWLADTGITLDRASRRPVIRDCLDWTERRPHLAGLVGAAICEHALRAGWVVRIGSGRAVKVTAEGAERLGVATGAEPAPPGAAPAVPAAGYRP
jgi:DNA-binding transcriptional ArsR family regulator